MCGIRTLTGIGGRAGMKTWVLSLASLGGLALAPAAHAAVINFESYGLGNLATNHSLTTAAFTAGNQGGWSDSTSDSVGSIITTASSGAYVGGKAAGIPSSFGTYIGANASLNPGAHFSFDFRTTNQEVAVGGWSDGSAGGAADGLFQNTETGISAGIVSVSGTARFGFREANFGTRDSSGVTPASGDWYHVDVTLDDATFTATMDVTDLSTGAVVDLNGAAAGTSYAVTRTAATFGPVISAFSGVYMRVSNTAAIDNIQTAPVPEPASLGMLALGGLTLLARRRS